MSAFLPHSEIFHFYEGTERDQFTDGIGANFNKAPDQLLANDLALASKLEEFELTLSNYVPPRSLLSSNTELFGGLTVQNFLRSDATSVNSNRFGGLLPADYVKSSGRGGARLAENSLSLSDNGTNQFTGIWYDPSSNIINIQTKVSPNSNGQAKVRALSFMEGNEPLSDKYLGKLSPSADSAKLGGKSPSEYLASSAAAANSLKLGGLPASNYQNLNQGSTTQNPNNAISPVICTKHANNPTLEYYHIQTLFYSTVSSTANRSQIATSYTGSIPKTHQRHFSQGSWTEWVDLTKDTIGGSVYGTSDSGYTVQANGLILQWGVATLPDGTHAYDLPITFPNAVLFVSGSPDRAMLNSQIGLTQSAGMKSNSSIYITCDNSVPTRWFALGN